MRELHIETAESRQVVDITDQIEQSLSIDTGTVLAFVTHTTCALTTADLDPGTDQDMNEAFWEMIPKLKFRHAHNPEHTPAHLLASLLGPSLSMVVEQGRLRLGEWQRAVLLEFDGPRTRTILLEEQSRG